MLPQPASSIYQTPKCFVRYGTLTHIDEQQSITKGKPWSVLKGLSYLHKVDLIVPQHCASVLREQVLNKLGEPVYHRVTATLGQLLEREFLTQYIKTGTLTMFTRGKRAVANCFTLYEGVLTLYLDKETYERAGLVGQPYGAKGGRKLKPRWVVIIDLKVDSMNHGKKGFERLLYACKTVFREPVTWLCTTVMGTDFQQGPFGKMSPTTLECTAWWSEDFKATAAPLKIDSGVVASGDRLALEETAVDIYEWLALLRLRSPRVLASDRVDPYISRYETPEASEGSRSVCMVTWQGLVSSTWLRNLATTIHSSLPQQEWYSIAATEFSSSLSGATKEVVMLRPHDLGDEYLMWEIQGVE